MPLFQYIATDLSGKEVRGSIEAQTPEAAKTALENIHLSGISVREATRNQPPPPSAGPGPLQSTFAFEGTDSTGMTRRGTIQAQSKYEAFEKLRQDQGLRLTMLSPLGVTPKYQDPELQRWQGTPLVSGVVGNLSTKPAETSMPNLSGISAAPGVQLSPRPVVSAPLAPQGPRKPLGFAGVSPAPVSPPKSETAAARSLEAHEYHPLMATLRLYAGWLLAWYGLFVALGYYVHNRTLPWSIPFVEAFFLSPLIFSFTVAIFLFLLLSAIHKAMRGGLITAIGLGIVAVLLFLGVRMSIS